MSFGQIQHLKNLFHLFSDGTSRDNGEFHFTSTTPHRRRKSSHLRADKRTDITGLVPHSPRQDKVNPVDEQVESSIQQNLSLLKST